MVKSEDCLYLNIYVPSNTTSKNNKFAVMLYIHGGSLAIGGADIYSGDILSAFNDVIVVTINYRLNVFGFLSNGTKSSGNYGLWDMRMAIQWVHDHINEFGGDPTRVTLFGNSAGGLAVMYQAIYPQNKGLFQRIVAQSGSVLGFWAFQKNPTEVFAKYIKDTNCDLSDYDQIIECLRSKSVKQLQTDSWSFVPIIDRDFLYKDPSLLLSEDSFEGKYAQEFFAEIDVIIGATSSDGAVNVPSWEKKLKEKQINIESGVPRSYFENVYVPERLKTMFGKTSKVLTESVIHQYTDWTRPNDALMTRRNMVEFTSDIGFFLPEITSVQKHSDIAAKSHTSASFFFIFDQKPSFVPYPDWLKGATHTMEVAYVFGLHESLERKLVDDLGGVNPFKVTQDDINLSAQMMTLWSNFAKSG
jgi:carboxylesterase type B